MSAEAVNLEEAVKHYELGEEPDLQVEQREAKQQEVKTFISGMKEIKFDGRPRGKFDLDTFVFLTRDKNGSDRMRIVSWAKDSSRNDPGYIKVLLGLAKLPKGKEHPQPYPNKYESERKGKACNVAFATGPGKGHFTDGVFLFRPKGASTEKCFERLRKAAETLSSSIR